MNVIQAGQYELIDAEAGIIKAGGRHWRTGRPAPLPAASMTLSEGSWYVADAEGDLITLEEIDYSALKKQRKAEAKAQAARKVHQAEAVVKDVHYASAADVREAVERIGAELIIDTATGTAALVAPRSAPDNDALLESLQVLGKVLALEPACGMKGCRRKATRATFTGFPLCEAHGEG